ncbi:MAG: TIR domain-containing protein, partial [Candidatus Korobacteraceae bacterium]
GENWAASIIDALDQSKIMVLIFSSNANASMQIEREVERAVHKGVHIIPLRIENTTPTKTLEYFISAPHWLDALSTPLENHISNLASAVKALLSRTGHVHEPALAMVPPVVAQTSPSPQRAVRDTNGGKQASSRKAIAASVAVLVIVAVIIVGARTLRQPAPTSDAETREAVVPAETPAAAVTATPSLPASATPPVSAPQATMPSSAAAVAPVQAKAVRPRSADKLLIDFNNSVDEGMISLDLDGKNVWTTLLGKGVKSKPGSATAGTTKTGIPRGPVSAEVNLRQGAYQAKVTLLNEDGKVRDVQTIPVEIGSQATPRTLHIRLSRFKKDLQHKLIDGQAANSKSVAPGKATDAKVAVRPSTDAKATASTTP